MTITDWPARWARGHWAEDEALQRTRLPVGPRNSWSNLPYGACGIAAGLLQSTDAGFLFALGMLALCYGSWRYHAEKTVRANLLDRVGMFLVLVQLGLGAWWPWLPGVWSVTLAAAVVAVYVAPLKWMDAQIGCWLLLALVGTAVHGGSLPLAVASMLLFFAGYLCWQLDKRPSMPLGLWGHACWHLLTAPAFLLMWLARP